MVGGFVVPKIGLGLTWNLKYGFVKYAMCGKLGVSPSGLGKLERIRQ